MTLARGAAAYLLGKSPLFRRVVEVDDPCAPPNFAALDEGCLILFAKGLEQAPYYRVCESASAALKHHEAAILSLPIGAGWLIEDIGRRFAETLASVIEAGSLAIVFLGRTDALRGELAELAQVFRHAGKPVSEDFLRRFADVTRFLEISSLADAGCGDFSWMEKVSGQFSLYFGLDRDEVLIADLDQRFGTRRGHFFVARDIAEGPLPKVDAILCRDLFEQNSIKAVSAMLGQIKASGAKYLLASTTPGKAAPFDLGQPPFSLPPPFFQFAEEEGGAKLLGVWRIPDKSQTPTDLSA